MILRLPAIAACLVFSIVSIGCTGSTNPSFPLSVAEANADLERMRAEPLPVERPIVVLGGYADPGFATSHIRNRFRDRLLNATIVTVTFGDQRSMDEARRHLLETMQLKLPSDDPQATVEVDVVASSMGGLIARHAAMPRDGERTLRAARIFTISTPHLGSTMAASLGWTPLMRELQPGSDVLTMLNDPFVQRSYELIPYARTNDELVGEQNTAPPGEIPWWTPAAPFLNGHLSAFDDPRINADILKRLRGEPPFTTEPRTPLPGGSHARGRSPRRPFSAREPSRVPAPRVSDVVFSQGTQGAL